MDSLDIILERAFREYTQEEKTQMAARKNESYVHLLDQMSPADLSVEVKDTLDELRKRGYKLAIGSSSKNILYAAVTAKAKGLKVIGLTGQKQNKLEKYCDSCIKVPETETYKIQELHLPVYHCLCLMLEKEFFNE